ncbi:MAG: Gx transporter family protein [Pleomorphochaeta sp.]
MISQNSKNRLIYLTAFALLLSSIEYLIPKPLPFLKIGLANLPLLLGASFLPFHEIIILSLSKSIVQNIISGTILSPFFIITLLSTLSASIFMFISYKLIKRATFIGISVIGAIINNLVQISLSALFIYGSSIFIALPLILSLGIITSIVLGVFANILDEKSIFIQKAKNLDFDEINYDKNIDSQSKMKNIIISSFSFLFIILTLFLDNLIYLTLLLILSYILQKYSKRKIKFIYPIVLLFSMLLLSLFDKQGKVLFSFYSIIITEDSLIIYLTKALRILIFIAVSQSLVSTSLFKFDWVQKVFYLSSRFLNNFSKTSGSFITRIDNALLNSQN